MSKPSRTFVPAIFAISVLAALAINPLHPSFWGAFAASSRAAAQIFSSRPNANIITPPPRPRPAPTVSSLSATLANLPLAFEPNRGQAALDAAYLARGTNFNLSLNSSGAIITLPRINTDSHDPRNPRARVLTHTPIHLSFTGASPAPAITPQEPLLERVNYYNRTDSTGHPINQLPTFARVEYKNIYPGVDLAYHGTRRQLEYDFVVAPGADPNLIRMDFSGAKSLTINPAGNLLIETSAGLLTERLPHIYQPAKINEADINSPHQTQIPVSGTFRLTAHNQVHFALGPYDHTKPLIIDPTLVYQDNFAAPPFNGNDAEFSAAYSVAVAPSGIVYLTNLSVLQGSHDPYFPKYSGEIVRVNNT